jgi:hypothetical protein
MALLDLWNSTPDQLNDKQVHQLIAFAGAGRLLDESPCSTEFRAFLASVPAKHLQRYANQCLTESFEGSGFALQDIVNEVGARIGATVSPGRYRGTIWSSPNANNRRLFMPTGSVRSFGKADFYRSLSLLDLPPRARRRVWHLRRRE